MSTDVLTPACHRGNLVVISTATQATWLCVRLAPGLERGGDGGDAGTRVVG